MTQGLPPKPTCLSIVGGILLAILILAAFALLPNIVKWVGAAFTFVPGQLGLIQVVAPDEVMLVDMRTSPSAVDFSRSSEYAVFTANADLLTINDAVLAAKAKPWFRLADTDGDQVAVTLIERGLAFYDTPFARGRPVARFEITTPGMYSMTHPRRFDFVYIVPDYTSGNEDAIGVYMLFQAAIIGGAAWYVRKKIRKPLHLIVPPPPSRTTREKFEAEQAEIKRHVPTSAPMRESSGSVPRPPAPELASAPGGRDVLQMVHEGNLTAQQAETAIESLMLSQPAGTPSSDWGAKLALTRSEAAAYSQGAGANDLLTLRYDGWPSACVQCGQPLEHQDLSWWFVRDEQGRPAFRHIECPAKKA